MRVLFWSPYPTEGASNRYRIEQYLPYLRKEGIQYTLHSFWSSAAFNVLYKRGRHLRKFCFFILGTASRLADIALLFRFDLVFIHREACPLGGAFFETFLHVLNKPIIFDFDDALFLPVSSVSNSFVKRLRRPDKIAKIIGISQHVIAGNPYLAEYASRYNSFVSIIPTSIDTDSYFPREKPRDGKIVIGWIGSFTTAGFLFMLEDVFRQLSKRFANIQFKIIGGNLSINGLNNIINTPWSMKTEKEDLGSIDIGIMPMPENRWTRGKCGFKAVLYMSKGIPCVCSPVGITTEIVIDGKNGFLAKSDSEWIEKLSALIENPVLRNTLALAGRKTAEEKYSVRANANKIIEIIRKVDTKR